MLTMLEKNKKIIILLALLFLITGIHYVLSCWYADSYDYVKYGHHDFYWQSISYKIALLGILGEIGLVASSNIIVKAVSLLCLIPSVLFSFFIIKLYQLDGTNNFLPIKDYYDYLSTVPFVANPLISIILIYFLFFSLSKE